MGWLSLGVFLACSHSAPARANDFLTGKQLLAYCEQPAGSAGRTFCTAYIEGAWASMWSTMEALKGKRMHCPDVTSTQLVDTVKHYLNNPEKQQYTASSSVDAILAKTYPCRWQ